MIDHSAWGDRLKEAAPSLRDVAAMALLTGEAPAGLRTPAALVYPIAVAAMPNSTTTIMTQRVEARVGVILCVKNVSDRRGNGALDDLRTVQDEALAALVNWRPSPDFTPVEYSRGRLFAFEGGTLIWQDEYVTSYLLMQPRSP